MHMNINTTTCCKWPSGNASIDLNGSLHVTNFAIHDY
jgi:hypothetical protein